MTNEEIDDGGPAFPMPGSVMPSGMLIKGKPGMPLRDWFAGQASEKDIEEWAVIYAQNGTPITREEARYAYADAMLRARKAQHDT